MRDQIISLRLSRAERALVALGARRYALTASELIRQLIFAELRFLAPPEIAERLSEPLEKKKREGPAA